jgi:hypothetical protein
MFDMVECNLVSTAMEQNLKLTSKEGNEFDVRKTGPRSNKIKQM